MSLKNLIKKAFRQFSPPDPHQFIHDDGVPTVNWNTGEILDMNGIILRDFELEKEEEVRTAWNEEVLGYRAERSELIEQKDWRWALANLSVVSGFKSGYLAAKKKYE